MKETKQDTPVDVGTTPAFPPEVAQGSIIGSADTTATGDGTINDAVSAPTKIEPAC